MSLNKELVRYILETYDFVDQHQAEEIAKGVEFYLYESVIPDAVNDNVDRPKEVEEISKYPVW